MIRIHFEIGKQEGFAGGPAATAVGFDGYEDAIDLRQALGIVALHHPALLGGIVLIKDSQFESAIRIGSAPSPYLKRAGIFETDFAVEVIGIKNQRLVLGVKDASIRFARLAGAGDIIDFGHIKIACTHELTNVAVMRKQLAL